MHQLQAPLVSCIPSLGTCCRSAPGASSLPLTFLPARETQRQAAALRCLLPLPEAARSKALAARIADRGARPPGPASLQLAAHQARAPTALGTRVDLHFRRSSWGLDGRHPARQQRGRPAGTAAWWSCARLHRQASRSRTRVPNTRFSREGPTFRSASLAEAFDLGLSADRRVCTTSKRPSSAATDCWVPARALRPVSPRCRCREAGSVGRRRAGTDGGAPVLVAVAGRQPAILAPAPMAREGERSAYRGQAQPSGSSAWRASAAATAAAAHFRRSSSAWTRRSSWSATACLLKLLWVLRSAPPPAPRSRTCAPNTRFSCGARLQRRPAKRAHRRAPSAATGCYAASLVPARDVLSPEIRPRSARSAHTAQCIRNTATAILTAAITSMANGDPT